MRSTLKIKTRLLLTVAFVALTLGIGSGLALWTVRTIGLEVQKLVQEDTRAARASIAGVRSALRAYQRDAAAAAATPDAAPPGPDALPRLERQTDDLLTRLNAQIEAGGIATDNTVGLASRGIAFALLVGLLLVAALLRLFVYRPIVAEASALATVCDAVTVGDFSSRVADPSETELGRVARSLNAMLDNT
ncbi:MAG: HAMP domain-containing protein, partial [Vicinamibacterales bacterium]